MCGTLLVPCYGDLADLRLRVGDDDTKGLHAESEARQTFHKLVGK